MNKIEFNSISIEKIKKNQRIEKSNMIRTISSYSGAEFEQFLLEWLKFCKNKINENSFIAKVGGTGDKGIDIYYKNEEEVIYYQAKQFDHPLNRSEIIGIVMKILWYVNGKEIDLPTKLFIISSKSISVKALVLFKNKELIKDELLTNLESYAKDYNKNISDSELKNLYNFINSLRFDFVDYIEIDQIILEYYNSDFGSIRFNKSTTLKYVSDIPRSNYEQEEFVVQLSNLFDGDKKKNEVLNDAKNSFYSSLCLMEAEKYLFGNNSEFKVAKDEIYEGINNIFYQDKDEKSKYFDCLSQAINIDPNPSYLASAELNLIKNTDKKGICHQLVNDGRISWEDKDER